MSEGLNRVMLLGSLGADPELRFGQNAGSAVLKMRLATTERYMDNRSNEWKERTDWHNVVMFGKRAEAMQKMLRKGSRIFIEGRIQTSSYEKDGQKIWRTDIVATQLLFAGGDAGERTEQATTPRRETPRRPDFGGGDSAPNDFGPPGGDDDIPFASQHEPCLWGGRD